MEDWEKEARREKRAKAKRNGGVVGFFTLLILAPFVANGGLGYVSAASIWLAFTALGAASQLVAETIKDAGPKNIWDSLGKARMWAQYDSGVKWDRIVMGAFAFLAFWATMDALSDLHVAIAVRLLVSLVVGAPSGAAVGLVVVKSLSALSKQADSTGELVGLDGRLRTFKLVGGVITLVDIIATSGGLIAGGFDSSPLVMLFACGLSIGILGVAFTGYTMMLRRFLSAKGPTVKTWAGMVLVTGILVVPLVNTFCFFNQMLFRAYIVDNARQEFMEEVADFSARAEKNRQRYLTPDRKGAVWGEKAQKDLGGLTGISERITKCGDMPCLVESFKEVQKVSQPYAWLATEEFSGMHLPVMPNPYLAAGKNYDRLSEEKMPAGEKAVFIMAALLAVFFEYAALAMMLLLWLTKPEQEEDEEVALTVITTATPAAPTAPAPRTVQPPPPPAASGT